MHEKTYVVRQQPPHPRRLTSFIELFHAANFGPSTACGQVPFTFPATAVILGSSILLLSTVDPLARAGHGDPNRGTLPGETGHQYVTVDSLFCFPYFPLVTLYLFLFDFPLPLPFSFRVLLLLPPLSGNGLAPRYSHVATVPFSRACR